MKKRIVSRTVIASILITGVLGMNIYANEDGLYVDTLETVPVGDELLLDEGGTEDTNANNMKIYDAVEPVDYVDNAGDNSDEGTAKTDGGSDNKVPQGVSTELQEATGISSMADDSEVDMYSGHIIDMVLPVVPENAYDFAMDPQDILSRYSKYKDNYRQSSIYFTSHTGGILHRSTSDAALAVNRSTVPVLLTVTLDVDNPYDWPVTYTDKSSVEADDAMNVSFELVPVSYHKSQDDADSIEAEADSESGSVIASENESETISESVADADDTSEAIKDDILPEEAVADDKILTDEVSENNVSEEQDPEDLESPFGNKDIVEIEGHRVSTDENGRAVLQMFIPADIDNFEKYGDGYILKDDADFTSYGWVVDGACNTQADWNEIIRKGKNNENMSIHITYQMRALTEEEAAELGDDVITVE